VNNIPICPVCGGIRFHSTTVLWDELIADWELSPDEVDYINRQQGFSCVDCGSNLRSMALAHGILKAFDFCGTLEEFVCSDLAISIKVLEVNEAGGLSPILKKIPNHTLITFPEHDMQHLVFDDSVFDLVLHSDSLEHVPDPVQGLFECRRILRDSGLCLYTVPLVVGRLTRSRSGMKNSYHGSTTQNTPDYIVRTEFGADMWRYALEAGFSSTRIHCFEYPAALAIEGIK